MNKTYFAAGADMKNRALFVRGDRVVALADIEDLASAPSYEAFREGARDIARLRRFSPDVAACDAHPGYFSSRYVLSGPSWFKRPCRVARVQHHHAHIASVMYEKGSEGPVLGVSFDGTGYGADGRIWGGEFLVARPGSYERAGHLRYVMMPGGGKVTVEPWRMVLGVLGAEGAGMLKDIPGERVEMVLMMMEKGVNSPYTSSAGRIFDAAAALAGICVHASFEAEGPILLEKLCKGRVTGGYPYTVTRDRDGALVADLLPALREMARDVRKKTSLSRMAEMFHNTVSELIIEVAGRLAEERGIVDIALSGGVFQNRYLVERLKEGFSSTSLNVSMNRELPPNDLNIAHGQYWASRFL